MSNSSRLTNVQLMSNSADVAPRHVSHHLKKKKKIQNQCENDFNIPIPISPFSPQISSSLNPIYRHPRPPPPSNTHEPAISTNVQQHVGSISISGSISVSISGSSSISISTGAVGPAPSPSPDLLEAPPFVLHLQATLSSLEKIRQLGSLYIWLRYKCSCIFGIHIRNFQMNIT
jgi:hypothetical protein